MGPDQSINNPDVNPDVFEEQPFVYTMPRNGVLIGGAPIEQLFARAPESESHASDSATPAMKPVFRPFTPQEVMECLVFLGSHPNVHAHNYSLDAYNDVTTKPPQFCLSPEDPTLAERQADYDRKFLSGAETLAHGLLSNVLDRCPVDVVLAPIWRAGLAFAGSADKRIASHWHIGAKRDPVTLKSSFYFSSEPSVAKPEETILVVADPMVGTASAMAATLRLIKETPLGKAIPDQNIHVACLFLAPEGGVRLMSEFPDIHLHTVSMDSFLNDQGWVIPTDPERFLGDFGDCFAARGLTPERLALLREANVLDSDSFQAIHDRVTKGSVVIKKA